MSRRQIHKDHWYTTKQAAPFLKKKPATVAKYCREGRLSPVRKQPEGIWKIRGSALIKFLNQ